MLASGDALLRMTPSMIIRPPKGGASAKGGPPSRPPGAPLEIRVCTKSTCKKKGAEQVIGLMEAAAADAGVSVTVKGSGCLGPCSFGVNAVAGWGKGKQIIRANVCRPDGERSAKVSNTVYDRVETSEDCDAIVAALVAAGGE